MNDAEGMGRVEALADLEKHAQHLARLGTLGEPCAQRRARHQLHDQEHDAVD